MIRIANSRESEIFTRYWMLLNILMAVQGFVFTGGGCVGRCDVGEGRGGSAGSAGLDRESNLEMNCEYSVQPRIFCSILDFQDLLLEILVSDAPANCAPMFSRFHPSWK